MKITIHGRIPSKKNSKRIICKGKSPRMLSSAAHVKWEKEQMKYLEEQGIKKEGMKSVHIVYNFLFPDLRNADISNKMESINDLLVKYGLIHDDNWRVLTTFSVKSGIDRDNPRCEMLIRPGLVHDNMIE